MSWNFAMERALNWDVAIRAAAAQDFGHLVHHLPLAVMKPLSAAEIVVMVRLAANRGLRVAARGHGHSVFGRSQVDGGVVIDMSGLTTVRDIGPDQVVVAAGATWRSVLAATLPLGLAPPVLTDYLDLSVGGTVSVGGTGAATHRYGMQSCNVIELDVVTGEGQLVTCSATHEPDLFHAVRAGLGQCGIITAATLCLVPAHEHARHYTLRYRDLRTMIADQRRLLDAQRVDHLDGTILADGTDWRYQLEAAVLYRSGSPPDDGAVLAGLNDERDSAEVHDLSYLDLLTRLDPLEHLLRSTGEWFHPHPWFNAFLCGSNAGELVAEILDRLTGTDLGTYGRVVLYPIRTRQVTTSLLRLPDEEVVFVFAVLRFPPNNPAEASRMVAANRALYDRVRASGGTGYPVSAVAMTPSDWKDHFGPMWPRLREAKERYDPRHILTPGQAIF